VSLRPATQFSRQGVIGKKLKKDTNGVPRLSRRLSANGEDAKVLSGRCLHAWIDSFPACSLHPSTSLPLSQGLFIMHMIEGVVTTPKLSPPLRHSTSFPGYFHHTRPGCKCAPCNCEIRLRDMISRLNLLRRLTAGVDIFYSPRFYNL
jgi:hypothetical protein